MAESWYGKYMQKLQIKSQILQTLHLKTPTIIVVIIVAVLSMSPMCKIRLAEVTMNKGVTDVQSAKNMV